MPLVLFHNAFLAEKRSQGAMVVGVEEELARGSWTLTLTALFGENAARKHEKREHRTAPGMDGAHCIRIYLKQPLSSAVILFLSFGGAVLAIFPKRDIVVTRAPPPLYNHGPLPEGAFRPKKRCERAPMAPIA